MQGLGVAECVALERMSDHAAPSRHEGVARPSVCAGSDGEHVLRDRLVTLAQHQPQRLQRLARHALGDLGADGLSNGAVGWVGAPERFIEIGLMQRGDCVGE